MTNNADGPGLGGVFALAGVCCCATDGALGRSVIVCFNWGLVTYACAGLEINGSCENGAGRRARGIRILNRCISSDLEQIDCREINSLLDWQLDD